MILLGSDHGGVELKDSIAAFLRERGISYTDCGTSGSESVDYPDYADRVASAVSSGTAEAGILFCGTGIGISIAANKFPGVRAALATDPFMAQMAKEHNNANILVLGGRTTSPEKGREIVAAWLDATFAAGRHQARLDKITEIEKRFCKQD
jgi:ribose 5-phosphate isomerase B